ncbi:MAG TPA: hypothetical protein VIU33_00365, partial [Nitrospiria bacterium]
SFIVVSVRIRLSKNGWVRFEMKVKREMGGYYQFNLKGISAILGWTFRGKGFPRQPPFTLHLGREYNNSNFSRV